MARLGNYGGAYGTNMGTGSGIVHTHAPFGHVTLTGETGQTRLVPITALYPKFDQLFKGVWVQAIGTTAVAIDYTLADVDLALSPAQNNIWTGSQNITASSGIVNVATMATVIRVNFTTGGVLYLAGV